MTRVGELEQNSSSIWYFIVLHIKIYGETNYSETLCPVFQKGPQKINDECGKAFNVS
jgi:hypothetical protein